MNFFKPTIIKIVISIILLVISSISIFKSIPKYTSGDLELLFWSTKVLKLPERNELLSELLISEDLPGEKSDYYQIGYRILVTVDALINTAISYLFSCLIVWIYNKFRFG